MNDRIKLAEAMGWLKATSLDIWYRPEDQKREGKNYNNGELPDPLTDANDDYAVLEWMRQNLIKDKVLPINVAAYKFYSDINDAHATDYEVGDYARAALKVIENARLLKAAQGPCPLA